MDTEASYHTSLSTHVQFPIRQPKNAPEGNTAQTNEGFARFLKEHASPKHHRVTAGGRIVPMSIQASPTPEFKPPVKRSEPASQQNPSVSNHPKIVKEEGSKADGGSQRRRRTRTTMDNNNRPEASRRRDSATSQINKGTTIVGSTRYQTPAVASSGTINSTTPGQLGSLNFISNLGNLGMDGISMSQGQTDQPGFPFPNLQQYYTQAGIPQLASDQGQGASQTQYVGPVCNIGPYPTTPGLGIINPVQMYQAPGAFNPFIGPTTPGANLAQSMTPVIDTRGLNNMFENAIQEFETTSTQLSNLDRYMAVHTWDIDPASKKILVIQRMELVTKLDAARVLKENLETILRTAPSSEPAMTTKAQSKFPNAGAQDYIAAAPCTPSVNFQSAYHRSGPPDTGGSSFSVSDAYGFMSPIQMSESPYLSPEPYCDNGYLAGLPQLGTANNLTTPGFNPTGGIFDKINDDDDDDDDMRIITSPTGQTVAEPNNTWVPPPELNAIYQKIEAAAKRNEPLGLLFQELAKVTAHMTRLGTHKGRKLDNYSRRSDNGGSSQGTFEYMTSSGIEVPRARASARLEIVDPKGPRQGTTATKAPTTSRNPAAVGSSKDHTSPKKLSTLQQSPLSFTPCRQNCRKRDSRKVETLAIEQKVNAHGYLPPFDGGGDVDGSPGRASQTESNNNKDEKTETGKSTANTESTWMDLLRRRPDPNPMDVRRFFKLLRDEDSVALDKYRKERERRAFG
ncbi:uncharacterized protein GIQ15_02462 [Arthroderma uncinatum]|uniref:uncharacterized protein n=1 Tax=Arthroderma uncinatum TaxID=74035 RepID=UPI00144AA0D8|nr:uncharacterized protein GIQ15_02462 [Arthroderma uncinatum]KAF3483138.1 hypothetical protein GIQ15_02462 [Arthroderma uncinatum]